jgi:serine protease Do
MTAVFPVSPISVASGDLAARLNRSLVAVRSRAGGGSGTVWTAAGLVVTNSHVVPGDHAEVVTHNDRVLEARLVARDPSVDLALLRVDADDLEPVEAGDSASLRPGQFVYAIGNPWGQRGSVTAGIVLTTNASTVENGVPLEHVIRADLRLAPGNSGGPLVDAAGRVIGINAMIAGGMAVAIPSNTVVEFVATASDGEPGFLGVTLQQVQVPHAIAASYSFEDDAGLMLTDIEPGSAAEQAGLLPGDVLVGIDGERGRVPAVARRLQAMRAGRTLRLALLRGGKLHEASATPVARA